VRAEHWLAVLSHLAQAALIVDVSVVLETMLLLENEEISGPVNVVPPFQIVEAGSDSQRLENCG
jgi:hypothetical protein